MNNIIRFWNQNRKSIIVKIIAIVLVIVVIQLLNQIVKMQNEEKNRLLANEVKEDLSDLPMQSMITGEKVDKEMTESNVELIETFITLCNEAKTKEAYNMLTDECKSAVFNTEEQFIKVYYNVIFKEKKLYGIENFRNSLNNYYTYEVKFYNDPLSTGKVQDTNVYQDYITIDKKQGKLNINSFIMERNINKTTEKNGIQVTISSKEVYKEYEKYNISVKNNTDKTILMDSQKSTQNVYAIGDDNGKYNAFISEIPSYLLEIKEGKTREYELKINKIYNPSITIKNICFSDVITDEEAYKKGEEDIEILKIEIDL